MGNERVEKIQETSDVNKEEHHHAEFSTNMSSLLANFSSLVSTTKTSDLQPQSACCGCNDITSTLRTFHIGPPVNIKHRLRRLARQSKHRRHRGGRPQNLAVAACTHQRPLLWPGRLGRNRRSEVSKLVQPAHLRYPETKSSMEPRVPSGKGSVRCRLNDEVVDSLRDNTRLTSVLTAAVSSNSSGGRRLFGSKTACRGRSSRQPLSFGDLSDGHVVSTESVSTTPLHAFSSCRTHFQRMPFASLDTRHKSDRTHPSLPALIEPPGGASVGAFSPAGPVVDSGAVGLSPGGGPGPSESDSSLVGRSCSQEVKMEDTNVNELASYLEDFLHIPRKMSTMAEMMYA